MPWHAFLPQWQNARLSRHPERFKPNPLELSGASALQTTNRDGGLQLAGFILHSLEADPCHTPMAGFQPSATFPRFLLDRWTDGKVRCLFRTK